MNKYYAVSEGRWGNSISILELRETTKMLIDDKNGIRFKKVEGSQFVASNRKFKDWSWTGCEIYKLDHEYPLQLIQENKNSKFRSDVKNAFEKKFRNGFSLDNAKKLNELFELGVDL